MAIQWPPWAPWSTSEHCHQEKGFPWLHPERPWLALSLLSFLSANSPVPPSSQHPTAIGGLPSGSPKPSGRASPARSASPPSAAALHGFAISPLNSLHFIAVFYEKPQIGGSGGALLTKGERRVGCCQQDAAPARHGSAGFPVLSCRALGSGVALCAPLFLTTFLSLFPVRGVSLR